MAKYNILIVEDEKETLEFMISILQDSFDCNAQGAEKSAEALKLIETNQYDLVILDIKLDGLSGLDIIKKVKENKDLPKTLIVTAWDSKDIAQQAIELGAIDYMAKPVDAEKLLSKVESILR